MICTHVQLTQCAKETEDRRVTLGFESMSLKHLVQKKKKKGMAKVRCKKSVFCNILKSAASLKCLSLHSSISEEGRSSLPDTFRKTFGQSRVYGEPGQQNPQTF